jgi:hypothetical protein
LTFFFKFVGYNFFFMSFILSIPHTLAIRNILLYSLFSVVIYFYFKSKSNIFNIFQNERLIFLQKTYFLLTLWIFFGLIFLAENQKLVFSEIKNYWIVPFLYFICSFVSFIIIYRHNKKFVQYLFSIIFIAFLTHIIYIDFYALQQYILNNHLISRFGGLEGTPDRASYVTNLLLGLLFAEIVYRLKTTKKFLVFDNFTVIIFLLLILMSAVIESMRNGVLTVVFLILTSLFLIFYKSNYSIKLKILISVVLFALLSFPLYYNLKNDARWTTLIKTIPIALDIENNKYWLNSSKFSIPKLPDGKNVTYSNYARIAWFKAGILFAVEKPFGIGYQRNSFGEAMQSKYGEHARSTSHSGFIDLLIGIGFLGVGIFFVLIYKIIKYSFEIFFKEYNYYSIALIFMVTGTISRFFVDPNLRDHMFLTFMFILGFLLAGLFETDEKIKINKSK